MADPMIQIYTGYAISEITDLPDIAPRTEKTIPENPSVRVSDKVEADKSGKTPVDYPETSKEQLRQHESDGSFLKNYPLEVVIPELSPFYHKDGALINEKTRLPLSRKWHYDLISAQSGKVSGDVVEYPSVRCYYWGGSNHTVPHITMGEQVIVLYHKGNNIYYWKELGRDNEMRRVEKYRIYVNDQQLVEKTADTAQKNKSRVNDDNSYYLEFDTINKHILLSTSASDGETIRYFMKFNTKTNTFALWDTRGNRFEIDSDQHRLYARNADQSVVDIHEKHINVWAQDSVNIEADTINLIGRVNYNETTGVDPSYKTSQLASRLHQQSYNGTGPKLQGGKDIFKPLTGTGTKTKTVATKEIFATPEKIDNITSWTIANQKYTFTGNEATIVTNSTTVKNQVYTFITEKQANITIKQAIINNSNTVWTGHIKQSPTVEFDKLSAKSITPF